MSSSRAGKLPLRHRAASSSTARTGLWLAILSQKKKMSSRSTMVHHKKGHNMEMNHFSGKKINMIFKNSPGNTH